MVIDRFSGPYGFLSNFAPAEVVLEGDTYPTVEHAFQAAKALPEDCTLYRTSSGAFQLTPWRQIIREAQSAAAAKRLGRRLPLRTDWEEIKVRVMAELLGQKFATGTQYLEQLLATRGTTLVEGNTWHDAYWGVCVCASCPPGKNMLGQILMAVRDAKPRHAE